MQSEELAFDELGEHLGQALLLDLEAGDRFSEHHPVASVSERFLVASLGGPDGSPGNAVAGLG